MKLHILFILCSLLIGPIAQAELWQSARTHSRGGMAIGGFGQVYDQFYSRSSSVMFFGQFTYGLSDDWQIETRLGFGMIDYYAGVFLKHEIFRGELLGLAVLGGVHQQLYGVADFNFIGSLSFDSLEVYLSPQLRMPLQGAAMGLGLVPGLNVSISHEVKLYAEGSVNLAQFYNSVGIGIKKSF